MAANNTSAGEQGAGGAVARGLAQLKEKVKELTLRLEREIKARKLDARLGMEAKKVRDQLTKETKILLENGRKLAVELKSTLGDASKRDHALKEARAKVAELKDELGRKTADLRRKSGELKKLAEESAHRAATVLRSSPESAPSSMGTESASQAAPTETDLESHPSDKSTPN
jgi:hypothetical protein